MHVVFKAGGLTVEVMSVYPDLGKKPVIMQHV